MPWASPVVMMKKGGGVTRVRKRDSYPLHSTPSAEATFDRLMERVLAGLHWNTCLVYLDEIIIFSPDFETHIVRLDDVLERIAKAVLKISSQ